jgi:hypothetical protein
LFNLKITVKCLPEEPSMVECGQKEMGDFLIQLLVPTPKWGAPTIRLGLPWDPLGQGAW